MLSNRHIRLAGAFVALCLLAALPLTVRADDVTHEATLKTTGVDPDAHGTAKFEVKNDNRLRLKIEVEDIFSTDVVAVFINGDFLTFIGLSGGRGELKLDTDDGDVVPVINTGDVIDIADATNGTLLLEGVFN